MPNNGFVSLNELFTVGRNDDFIIAWQRGEACHWRDFYNHIQRLSVQIQSLPYQRWGLYLDDSYNFSIALLALLVSGKVPVMAANSRPGTATQLCDCCDALLGDFDLVGSERHFRFEDLLGAPLASELHVLPELDLTQSLELFTSGSSGTPKLEKKQLSQLVAEVSTLQQQWGKLRGNAVTVATVSHQHIYGLLFKVLWPLSAGQAFVSHNYQDPQGLLEDAPRYGTVSWIASPAHLKRLHDDLPWQQSKNSLTAVFCSGGELPSQSSQQLKVLAGQSPLEVYGSTESGGIAWRQQNDSDESCCWQAFSGVMLSQGQEGQLQVESPHVYRGEPLQMADAVSFEGDGKFRLLGRLDRIVKVEGKRLSLPELESKINLSSLVETTSAVKLEDGARQLVGVVVVLNEEGEGQYAKLGKGRLVQLLKAELAHFFEAVLLPKRWRFVECIPVNQQGKILQQEVEKLFQRSLTQSPAKTLPTVLSEHQSGNQLTLLLRVDADLDYLPGHFPGAAIVPGVVQLRWAEYFGRKKFPLGIFSKMEGIKFQSVLRPDTEVKLTLDFDTEKHSLKFCFDSPAGVYSQGRLRFV